MTALHAISAEQQCSCFATKSWWDTVSSVCCVLQCLKQGVYSNADSAAGWKALAELQYQNRQFQEAYDTAGDQFKLCLCCQPAPASHATQCCLAQNSCSSAYSL